MLTVTARAEKYIQKLLKLYKNNDFDPLHDRLFGKHLQNKKNCIKVQNTERLHQEQDTCSDVTL